MEIQRYYSPELLPDANDKVVLHSAHLAALARCEQALAIIAQERDHEIEARRLLSEKLEQAAAQVAALDAQNKELQKEVRACIDRHQDIFGWQAGESRNALVVEIRDKVDAIFAALKGAS